MNGEVQLLVNSEVPTVIASISNNPIYIGIGALSRLIVTSRPEVAALTTGDSVTMFNAAGQSVVKTLNSNPVIDSPVPGQTRLNFAGTWANDYSAAAGGYFMLTIGGETYLDLFENESISQNWKFQDLNNFTAQGSFSREFRVPFSATNQLALGALFDVNVDAGASNYFHYKLPAEIRVDTLPIATGYVRVRKIYKQQNRINEVELAFYAETPDLVRNIGEKKLKDITDLPNLNEVIDYDNVTDATNERIWTLLERGELWSETNELNTRSLFDFDNPVYPADLTPAVRYDYLFEQILKDAGFELVAGSLLNILSTYYMPWLNNKTNVASDSFNAFFFRVYNSASASLANSSTLINMNTEVFDNSGDFTPGTATYTTPADGFYTFRFRNKFTLTGNNNISYFLDIDGVLIFLDNFDVVNNQIIDFTWRIGINAASVVQLKMKRNENSAVTLVAGDGTLDTSIWELVQTDLHYGQTIFYDLNAPDVKQIDFVTDVIKMHNCIIVSDRAVPNKISIVPQNNYLGSGSVLDWTSKLDISKDVTIGSTVDLQKAKFQFTYTAGEDIISKQYKNVKRVYGDYEAVGYTINPDTLPSDFAIGEQKIQLTMQSTPCGVVNGSTVIIPMFINEQLEFVQPGMRCLFEAGVVNIELLNDNIGFPTVTSVPVLNHYSQVIADLDDFDLNWAPEVPPYAINANPYNNLFNLYWRTFMNSLYSPEARMMEASFALSLKDIATFQFSDKIWIQDSYWRILEVSDYKVGDVESTKVKLLKFLEDTEDCSAIPSTISTNGEVNFVDANNDPVAPSQACCTRYGYNWDEANAVCWAFTPNGNTRPNNISGNSTTPAVRELPTATQTRGVLNSVINGQNVDIEVNNQNTLAVGERLKLTKNVNGSNLLGKNVTTNLPGMHVGGGYRGGDPANFAYNGWAQFGQFVLQRQFTSAASGNTFNLYIEGVPNEYIEIEDESVWSVVMNVSITDGIGGNETSLHHFTLDKFAALANASAITTIDTISAIGAYVFTFVIDTATNTDQHRINVTVTGGTYPTAFVVTASIQYQQVKISTT
jgi:hypothetical protein